MTRNIRIPTDDGYPPYLLCPQCGFEFMHIDEVSVHRGEDIVIVTGDKVSIDNLKNSQRGVIVTIQYSGECVHRGEIIFQFHKGNVLVKHNRLPDRPTKDNHFLDEENDIFRD